MASLEVVFRSEANTDFSLAVALYAAEDDGRLVPRFLRAVEESVDRIALYPRSGQKYFQETRRVLLNTFPFWLYYQILGQRIEVLAIIHAKRGSTYILERTK